MKTIRCNLTKTCRILVTFTESLYKYMGILPLKNQEISLIYRRITGPLKKLFHYSIFQKFFHIYMIH